MKVIVSWHQKYSRSAEDKTMHVKNGDKVQVAGRERGRTGTVKRIDSRSGRVLVDGLNMVKRHKRAGATNPESGIIEKEAFIDASNVLLYSRSSSAEFERVRYVGDSGNHFESRAMLLMFC